MLRKASERTGKPPLAHAVTPWACRPCCHLILHNAAVVSSLLDVLRACYNVVARSTLRHAEVCPCLLASIAGTGHWLDSKGGFPATPCRTCSVQLVLFLRAGSMRRRRHGWMHVALLHARMKDVVYTFNVCLASPQMRA